MAKRQPARDSRTEIFSAAAAEFAARGFEAAGVDRIAASARVNKAMIYYHYGSKLELYLEVLRDMLRVVSARARAIADGPGTAEHKVDTWVATIIGEAAQRPWFPQIMLRELAAGVTHFDAETVTLMAVVVGSVQDMIVQGQQDGSFGEADPLLTHLSIIGPVLLFITRDRAIGKRPRGAILTTPAAQIVAAPRTREQFIQHMQHAVRGMLRKD
jgi:TetR/AcrR family transcriptional regulator